ncbi:hypothetical protein CEXT_425441 [Caerostris extrusa]|uniref:Uncharacterized protein n=1 Tax=Caerostris extrusa TaxID=172846 RepID=A0AAV4YC61_CAEEX|nr:hypothetical protein CEXT_425441 [Caerostris extrusa]
MPFPCGNKQFRSNQHQAKKRRERDRQSKDILCRQCNWLAPRHHKTLPFIKSPAKVNNLGSFRSTSVWKKHIIYVLTLGSKVRSKSFGDWEAIDVFFFFFLQLSGKRIQLIDLFFNAQRNRWAIRVVLLSSVYVG